jgi:hypothetical protein
MHTTKKKREKKQRNCLGDEPLATNNILTATVYNTQTTLQNKHLQKGNNAQALSSPDRRSHDFTLDKARAQKNVVSKTVARYNQ